MGLVNVNVKKTRMKIRFVLKKVGVRHFVNFFDRRSPKLGGHCGMKPYSK